jgi:hypothetical protein
MMCSVSNSGDGQRNLNHAKVYVTKYHHAVWSTQYTGNKNDCLVLNADQFRPNDFYQYAASTLVDGSVIPGKWPPELWIFLPLLTRHSGVGLGIRGFFSHGSLWRWRPGRLQQVIGLKSRGDYETCRGQPVSSRVLFISSETLAFGSISYIDSHYNMYIRDLP